MQLTMGKKQRVLAELYRRHGVGGTFTNADVRSACKEFSFGNQFDVTKVDHIGLLPEVMRESDCFPVHLGEGRHKFLEGIDGAYRKLEDVDPQDYKYEKSLLNDTDSSESNVLFAAYNARLLHTFLYDERNASPKVYGARRTSIDVDYSVNKQRVLGRKVQMEIDMTLENRGRVTVIEAKNRKPEDFAVYQLFMPFLYYKSLAAILPIKSVDCCYIAREKNGRDSVIRAYLYDFADETRMDSIHLRKKKAYRLVSG